MTVIVTKNSSTASAVPTTSDLVQGELAVNVTDKRIFTENASTQIVELGTNPSSITTATATVTGTLTANGTFASSNAVLTGGTVNGVVIGGTTPQAITGTTVTALTGFVGGLTGNVTGNLTGNVTGNVTGNLTGTVTGNLTASSGTTTLNNLIVNGTADFTDTKLTNVATPTANTDAATKLYVDTAVASTFYLGAKAADPTLDNDGNPLVEGATYFNTTTDAMRVYDGAAWADVSPTATSVTLSQVTDFPTQTGNSGKYLTTNGTVPSWAELTTDPTLGSLDKTFTSAEEYVLTLSNASTEVPVVSALIEESGTDAISNSWMIDNSLYNFDRQDFAPSVDLTISSATSDGTYTVSSGSLSTYIGMIIEGNGGKAKIISSRAYELIEPFKNTNAMASGNWSLYGISYLSKNLQTITNNGNPSLSALNGATLVSQADIQSAASSQLAGVTLLDFSPDGLWLIWVDGTVMTSLPLQSPYDISIIDNSYITSNQRDWSSGAVVAFAFNQDGTRLYTFVTSQTTRAYNLSTPFDVTTASSFSTGPNTTVSALFLNEKEDTLWGLTGSTYGWAPIGLTSTGAFASDWDLQNGILLQNFARAAKKLGNGNVVIASREGYILIDSEFSILSNGQPDTNTDSEEVDPFAVSDNGDTLYFFHEGNDTIYGIKLGQDNNETYYHAITSGSLDTQYWTNIDTVTGIDNSNGLTSVLSYAVSTDEQDTFYVNAWRAGGYQRNIVRNNAGTWQYNSNTDYGSETWTNASSNDKFQAFNQAYGVTGDVGHYLNNFTAVTSELINGTDSAPRDVFMREDGLKFWMVGSTGDNVYEFNLAAAHNFTTITYSGNSFSISGQATTPYGLALSTDGLKMYVSETGTINQYTLSTAWDITTASFDGTHTGSIGFNFSNDGKYYYTINYSTDLVAVYELDTPWDTQGTTTLLSSQDITTPIGAPYGIYITPNGKELWVADVGVDGIYKFNLKTAWDVSSSSLDKSIYKIISYSAATTSSTYGINVSGSGEYLYFGNGFEIFQNTISETGSISGSGFLDTSNITLGDNLDVAVSLYSDNQTAEFAGVQIQYDAAASNRAAALGVDYTYDVPETGKVRLKSLKDANFKFRVV